MSSSTTPPLRAGSWSRYWSSGALHSLGGSASGSAGNDGNYAGELAAYWAERFAALPNHACLLELCCGNAPLLKLASQQTGQAFRLVGLDLAQVQPLWVQHLPAGMAKPEILAGNSVEAIPLPTQSVDCILSQFGFEYAATPAAIAEVQRVLRPQGRAHMVLHHTQSRPVSLARDELSHLPLLLGEQGFLALAAQMLEPLHRASSAEGRAVLAQDAAALRLRAAFNRISDELTQRAQQALCPDILWQVHDRALECLSWARRGDPDTAAAGLQALTVQAEDAQLRARELCDFAMSSETALGLAQALMPGGRHSLRPIDWQGHLMGWALDMSPA